VEQHLQEWRFTLWPRSNNCAPEISVLGGQLAPIWPKHQVNPSFEVRGELQMIFLLCHYYNLLCVISHRTHLQPSNPVGLTVLLVPLVVPDGRPATVQDGHLIVSSMPNILYVNSLHRYQEAERIT